MFSPSNRVVRVRGELKVDARDSGIGPSAFSPAQVSAILQSFSS